MTENKGAYNLERSFLQRASADSGKEGGGVICGRLRWVYGGGGRANFVGLHEQFDTFGDHMVVSHVGDSTRTGGPERNLGRKREGEGKNGEKTIGAGR